LERGQSHRQVLGPMTPTVADTEAIDILEGFLTYLDETTPNRDEDDRGLHDDIDKARAWLTDQRSAL
jgi:hypothetical protein